MQRIPIVQNADGTAVPAQPFPADAVSIRGDLDAGFYLCFQRGDDVPPLPELGGDPPNE